MVLNITVKTLDSQNYHFEANDDWTVIQFKEHIQPSVDVLPAEQRLIFCGRALQDDKKLTEYDCGGKVVHLVRRPPPPIENNNPSSDQPQSASDSNNNNSNFQTGSNENTRFLDESNVLFSAMALGPEMNHILRHILTLQQAIYTRTLADGTPVATNIEPLSMTDIDRHLHNAARLLRITINTINECMARIAAQPPTSARPASSEGSSLDPTRTVITAASSHTNLDLSRDDEMRTSDLDRENFNSSASTSTTVTNTAMDDINLGASTRESATERASSSGMQRQSLTTDDLPQSTTQPVPRLTLVNTLNHRSENRQAPLSLRQRGESELDRYLTILNYSCELQNQFQGLARRYRQLTDMSRRGGLIVPESTATSEALSQNSNTLSQSPQSNQMSSGLINEARILGLFIPRIMHHISHLQHALSNFTVDSTRGRLLLCVPTNHRSGFRPRQMARRTSNPGPPNQPQSQPQQQQQQAQNQQPSVSNSTQTTQRPIGVISGRIPLPFDYYLPCFSPWANYNSSNRTTTRTEIPSTRVEFRIVNRPEGVPRTQSATVNIETPSVQHSDSTSSSSRSPSASATADFGLTEVVSNIVGSIFRAPQSNQSQQQGANTGSNPPQQDPILNIIPEIALNAASQILGNVLGLPTGIQTPSTANQQQNPPTQQRQQTTSQSGLVMMDIDIDDNSSSRSESRYQDARESHSPTASSAQQSSIRPSSSQSHSTAQPSNSQGPTSSTSSVKFDRQHLVEVMQNHPDWIPIIEADINVMEQSQSSSSSGQPPFFSDAYLSSLPRKQFRRN